MTSWLKPPDHNTLFHIYEVAVYENLIEYWFDGRLRGFGIPVETLSSQATINGPPYVLIFGQSLSHQGANHSLLEIGKAAGEEPIARSFDLWLGGPRISAGARFHPIWMELYDAGTNTKLNTLAAQTNITKNSHPFPINGFSKRLVYLALSQVVAVSVNVQFLDAKGNWVTFSTPAAAISMFIDLSTVPGFLARIQIVIGATATTISAAEVSLAA